MEPYRLTLLFGIALLAVCAAFAAAQLRSASHLGAVPVRVPAASADARIRLGDRAHSPGFALPAIGSSAPGRATLPPLVAEPRPSAQ